VEQALRLLPDVDALGPLRAYLVSSSRAHPPAEPYGTVGKRYIQPADLRELMPRAVSRVSDHLTALYESAVEALEAEQRGNLSAAVRALLRAGEREERVGRNTQARAWYDHALYVAQELRDRRPEIETLSHLGHLETERGRFDAGARFYQRSLALAEAELDLESAAVACRGLGAVSLAQGKWQGAEAWYTRGLRNAAKDPVLTGHLYLGLAEAALRRGQVELASERVSRARETFEAQGHDEGAVLALNAWGRIETQQGRHAEALAGYREALTRLLGTGGNPRIEMDIRLNICRLHLDWGRLPDAEDEIRRTEETAIVHNFTGQLARLYVVMGQVRGRERDETGFVFFEKAIELCRGQEPSPLLEAEVYLAYSQFREQVGELEESRAYLERAREIVESYEGPLLAQIDMALNRLPPS
jgi:tetratricopeptide (TPR) repeat protein